MATKNKVQCKDYPIGIEPIAPDDPSTRTKNKCRFAWNPKQLVLIGMLIISVFVITALASIIGVYCGTGNCGGSSSSSSGSSSNGGNDDNGNNQNHSSSSSSNSNTPTIAVTNRPLTIPIIESPPTTTPIDARLSVACNFVSIWDLTECRTTTFISTSSAAVGSTIPSEMGFLTQLTFLDLCCNQLTGTIPTEIGIFNTTHIHGFV